MPEAAGSHEGDTVRPKVIDPVPSEVINAAKAAFGDRRASSRIAALTFDSLVDADDDVDEHVLRFTYEEIRIEVSVAITTEGRTLAGSASPGGQGRFELQLQGSDIGFVDSADDGAFGFAPLDSGLVRLSFTPEGQEVILTDWFRI